MLPDDPTPPMERVNNCPGDISQILSPIIKLQNLRAAKLGKIMQIPGIYIIQTYHFQLHSIFVKPSIQHR